MNLQHRTLIFFSALISLLMWASAIHARTTRSCNVEIYFISEQYQLGDRWINHTSRVKLNAGRMTFRASAPAASHNKARMRASKKAEACINEWWNRPHCMDAHSTSYGDLHGRASITSLMNQAICEDLRVIGRTDLVGRRMRGRLYGRIDGDRCCRDSSRGCPYNYGQSRVGRFNSSGLGGNELWPDVIHYVTCDPR